MLNCTIDYWIVKIDSSGLKQWDKRFGGTGADHLYAVEQTTDGGYILGGVSWSESGGDKTQDNWSKDTADFWIVKVDSAGSKQWDRRYGGYNSDFFQSLQQTSDGEYILGGWSESGIGGDKTQDNWGLIYPSSDYWIIKIDAYGNPKWDNRYGGLDGEVFYSLRQTTDGGFILGGLSGSGIGGDKTQPAWDTAGSADYWIVKTDSAGNKQWDKRFGGLDQDWFYSLMQTSDKGYVLWGESLSGIGGDKSEDTRGGNDYWIVKCDSSGNLQWDKRFGGTSQDGGMGNIVQTSDGGYLMAGMSGSPAGGDKTINNMGGLQTWLVKTNANGIKEWDKTIFTPGNDLWGFAIQSSDHCFIVANISNGGIGGYKTQDPWDTTAFPLTTYDYWIMKFCDTTLTSLNEVVTFENRLSIFPNPSHSLITVSHHNENRIIICNMMGVMLMESTYSEQNNVLDISTLPPGIYCVKAGNYVSRFVKL